MRRRLILLAVVFVSAALHACDDEARAPEPQLVTKNPFSPSAPTMDGITEAPCSIYRAQTCDGGVLRECSTYDTRNKAFVDPDPLTHRALLYERWHDLYFTPDGQAIKRTLTSTLPADATEEEWSSIEHFDHYHQGLPDSMIWTGAGLNAYMLRYVLSGNEVDYQRVEQKTRQLLTQFDVTGIPGFASRGYYYVVPDEAPRVQEHATFHRSLFESFGSPHWSKNPSGDLNDAPDIPELYKSGYIDRTGTKWEGATHWFGSPTIDMYSGVMTALPAAWGLIRDQGVKDRIARHMGCYLKRLRRVEIINLQKTREGADFIAALLESAETKFDADDPDLSKLDRIVFYVLDQPNELNQATFDRSCPDEIATEPARVIDLLDPSFELELFSFILDLDGKKQLRQTGVDHFYVPNVRGYDAVHLMHLAAMLYHMTGDDMYRTFLEEELIGDLNTLGVAQTWAAVIPPKWCRKWYTEHISFPPMWAFANLLADSPFKDRILEAIYEEVWLKDASELLNAKFGILYAGVVPERIGTGQQEALTTSVQLLREFGGNGGVLDAPRRNYPLSYDEVVSQLPEGITAECPSQAIVEQCEKGPTILGIELDGWDITQDCTGAANECVTENGQCAQKRASSALPPMLREQWGYQWQGDPYQLGSNQDGRVIAAGLDLVEPYWLARYYNAIPEAEGVFLAWKELGSCE